MLNSTPNQAAALAHYLPMIGQIRDEMAREHVLADVDTFADELGGECMKTPRVTSDFESRNQARLTEAGSPVVLHALLLAGQRGDSETALFCAKLLGDRYLAAHADRVQARYDQLASEGGE